MNKKAFTLLELLVVVLIIGILAAIALPQYNKAVWKSRFVQAKTIAKNIANSEEVYFTANGQYTNNFTDLDVDLSPNSYNDKQDTAYFNWGNCLLNVGTNDERRREVQCFIYKNGKSYLRYVLEFYGGTYFINRDWKAKRLCVATGENDKPISTDINYKICQGETIDTNPLTFGEKSLGFAYK